MFLDTNALSAYLDGSSEVAELISHALVLSIPVIVAAEFTFGFAQCRHRHVFERSIQRLLDRCEVLVIDIETTRHYAAIPLELKLVGKPIPSNDLWIAALSRQHAMPVITRDNHFDSVPGLYRRTW